MVRLFEAVGRSLANRQRMNDLEYTLEMIAAYKDLRMAKCDTCKELFDKRGMTPAARRSQSGKSAEGTETVNWIAVHESCL